MLEGLPGYPLVFNMMNTADSDIMLLLGKVPPLWTTGQSWPESEAHQGDWECDDTLWQDQRRLTSDHSGHADNEQPSPSCSAVYSV
jgi:hypothetical protein